MIEDLRKLVRPGLGSLAAYKAPPKVEARAKLDSNELPYSLPSEIAEALGRELGAVDLNRYPPASCTELRAAVADDLGIDPATLVFGNGSDEIITLLLTVFWKPRPGQAAAKVLYPTPSFVYYRMAAACTGVEPVELPLTAEFELDEEALAAAMVEHRPNVVFFARPNNPTGSLWSRSAIERAARNYPDTVVVADEAYIDYGGDSMLSTVGEPPNLVVMRTLSKLGFAALRIGFLVAHPDVAAMVEKARPPYNIGALNQRAATWILRNHAGTLHRRCALVSEQREKLYISLSAIDGVHPIKSYANLLLIRVGTPGDGRAHEVCLELRRRGVLLRDFDKPGPLSGHLRVTVGTPEENELFLSELKRALA